MKLLPLNRGTSSIARGPGLVASVTSVAGAALLGWSGYLHYHLWRDLGYRHIPTIGTLFVIQAVISALLAVVILCVRRVWAALLGAGFSLSTLAGLLVSIDHGLFGFKDSWAAPFARQTFSIEAVATLLLIGSATLWIWGPHSSSRRHGAQN